MNIGGIHPLLGSISDRPEVLGYDIRKRLSCKKKLSWIACLVSEICTLKVPLIARTQSGPNPHLNVQGIYNFKCVHTWQMKHGIN